MRNMKRQKLAQMLADSTEFRISDEARAAHLDAISEAIESSPAVVPQVRTRWSPSLRRRVTGLLVATMTLGPAGVAFASQGSLPGDSLYSAKRVVEHVQAVFDPSVSARHRLDEVSGLIARGGDSSEVARALQEAAAAVAVAPDGDALSATLEALQREVDPSVVGPVEAETENPSGPIVEPSEEPGIADGTDPADVQEPAESSDEPSVTAPEKDETTVSEPTEPAESPEAGSSKDAEAPEASAKSGADEPEHPELET